jgi:hypothetical protein
MTTTLYRVQDSQGHGPYVLAQWDGRDALTASHDDRTPPNTPDGYLSACTSRKALTSWFGPWLPALVASGFSIVKVTVDSASVSYLGQRVFNEASYRPAGVQRTRVCRMVMARYALASPAMPTTCRNAPNHVARMERELFPQVTPTVPTSRVAWLATVRNEYEPLSESFHA